MKHILQFTLVHARITAQSVYLSTLKCALKQTHLNTHTHAAHVRTLHIYEVI